MPRLAAVLAVSAAAAFAVPAPASAETTAATTAAQSEYVKCMVGLAAALPGFTVRTVAYTLEHGEPPLIAGPFNPC